VEGLPFSFTATLKGHPMPELVLEKDDVEIKNVNYDKDKKSFEYSKPVAELSDAGVFKLTAKNPSGQVVSEGKLEVIKREKDGPKYEPKFIYELCDKVVDEGNELVLFAKVDGNPLPNISWTFNDSPLSPEKCSMTFDGEKAILRLPIAERENQGVYKVKSLNILLKHNKILIWSFFLKCILENVEGKAESASNVTVNKVYRPPSFTQKFTDQEQVII
jgi:hypothetical protein